jgi:hypothetical protein
MCCVCLTAETRDRVKVEHPHTLKGCVWSVSRHVKQTHVATSPLRSLSLCLHYQSALPASLPSLAPMHSTAPSEFATLTAAVCSPTGTPAADLPWCYILRGLRPWNDDRRSARLRSSSVKATGLNEQTRGMPAIHIMSVMSVGGMAIYRHIMALECQQSSKTCIFRRLPLACITWHQEHGNTLSTEC